MILTLTNLRTQYDPDLSFVRLQWHSAQPGMAGFQQSLNLVACLVEQGTVHDALIDLHGLPNIGLEDQFWLATNWLPRVSVPAVQRAALVLPPSNSYNQLVVESLIRTGRHFMHYDIQFFTTSIDALDWLFHEKPCTQEHLDTEWKEPKQVSAGL
ncbi:hypothetical protein [Hymenobacter mucosus]|uniref:SpoIIAA-like n=1 Tax=Hymenobacter mucosus TaxID=1411120 RepID=A0A238XNQ5_9BACT|nr:hypothetical protein [Hymenobacter mucosus]SNR60656.1 hypothetical protein SAMN06269173_104269 [Hymenobacter mucosus]